MINTIRVSSIVNPNQTYDNQPTFTDGFDVASDVYAQRAPYKVDKNIDGTKYIFTEGFILLCDLAFSTGCVSGMSEEEYNLFIQLIDYEDRGTTANPAVIQLDTTLYNLSIGGTLDDSETCANITLADANTLT